MLLSKKIVALGLVKVQFPHDPNPQFCTVLYSQAGHYQFFGGRLDPPEDEKLLRQVGVSGRPDHEDHLRICFTREFIEKLGYSPNKEGNKIRTLFKSISNPKTQYYGSFDCIGFLPNHNQFRPYTFHLFLPFFKGFSFFELIAEIHIIPGIRWYSGDSLVMNKDHLGNQIMHPFLGKENNENPHNGDEKITLAMAIEKHLRVKGLSLVDLPLSVG